MLGEWLQRPHIAAWWGACRSVCLGRGLGTAMVGEFVQFLWRDPAVTRIQADPAPTNARAIRCYEKAGFHSLGLITTPDGPPFSCSSTARSRSVGVSLPPLAAPADSGAVHFYTVSQ
jgi:RimJ/RimL family protein N-acetyltransferase